jgi:hypothetical protein
MRRRLVALGLVLGVVLIFAFFVPVIPSFYGAITDPTPCGNFPMTCYSTYPVYRVSLTHAVFGVGGYLWLYSEGCNSGCDSSTWGYGFDT